MVWGQPVTDVLEEGQLRIRQTTKSEMTPLVSILIEGNISQPVRSVLYSMFTRRSTEQWQDSLGCAHRSTLEIPLSQILYSANHARLLRTGQMSAAEEDLRRCT